MNRRQFFKFGSLAAGAYVLSQCKEPPSSSSSSSGSGQVFTKEQPGQWVGKEAAHVPSLVGGAGNLKVKNAHEMTPQHYITKHELRDETGKVLAEKQIAATELPESTFMIPKPAGVSIFAFATCNQHGIWQQAYAMDTLTNSFTAAPAGTPPAPGTPPTPTTP
jgi:desulfoferrodoxin (superoxide reductase-like protein)